MPTSSSIRNGKESLEVSQIIEIGGGGGGGWGVYNVRSFSGHGIGANCDMITRQNFLYRSGNLDSITDLGKQKLNKLHVFVIFDPER